MFWDFDRNQHRSEEEKETGEGYAPCLILGACNPVFADKALETEPHTSTLLPCNVTIRELKYKSYVLAVMDPAGAMSAVKNPEIDILTEKVREKLMRVFGQFGIEEERIKRAEQPK